MTLLPISIIYRCFGVRTSQYKLSFVWFYEDLNCTWFCIAFDWWKSVLGFRISHNKSHILYIILIKYSHQHITYRKYWLINKIWNYRSSKQRNRFWAKKFEIILTYVKKCLWIHLYSNSEDIWPINTIQLTTRLAEIEKIRP